MFEVLTKLDANPFTVPIANVIRSFIASDQPHDIVGVCLAGSWMYNSHTIIGKNKSDRDFVVVYCPSPALLIYPKQTPTSTLFTITDGEQYDVRFIPVGEFLEQSFHGNPTAFESLLCFMNENQNVPDGEFESLIKYNLRTLCNQIMQYYQRTQLIPNGVIRCIKNVGLDPKNKREHKMKAHSYRLAILLRDFVSGRPTPYRVNGHERDIYMSMRQPKAGDRSYDVAELISQIVPSEFLDPGFDQSNKLDVTGDFREQMIKYCLMAFYDFNEH